MPIKDHPVAEYMCPGQGCGKQLRAAMGGTEAPKPGDLTVCAYCINWLTFDEDMRPRMITEEEIEGLDDDLFTRMTRLSKRAADVAGGRQRTTSGS